jgi:hypothetical protein
MGLLDKAKQAAAQGAAKAKEGVEDVQAKKDLHLAYVDLGKKTFELLEAGQLQHGDLDPLAERVRGLTAKLADEGEAETESEPAAPSGPPAMPV